jgi:hypothetical protein
MSGISRFRKSSLLMAVKIVPEELFFKISCIRLFLNSRGYRQNNYLSKR